MGHWDDIRTALAVARAGTVSGAALTLGIHHATVIRHIDTLEERLGTRLFLRHARGYVLTEAGQILSDMAGGAEERLDQMTAQIAGTGNRIEGSLIITSLPGLSGLVTQKLIGLMRAHPGLRVRYETDVRLFRLGAGEAHIAIRAGAKPIEPDYVVQPLTVQRSTVHGTAEYLAAHGPLTDPARHLWVVPGDEAQGAPLMRWLNARISAGNRVLVSNDSNLRLAAIRAGLGIGPVSPQRTEGLVEMLDLPELASALWLVTHVDLHRTPKVQAALAALKAD
ncbi:LysR family transcriptional regulator [Paracoccus pacificus]|uniref:LysR family transcriptional regulator n=1 Tax=Paracoccus pacificus TaxID=1463598 RepID=A0ABW4R948_9RHOB